MSSLAYNQVLSLDEFFKNKFAPLSVCVYALTTGCRQHRFLRLAHSSSTSIQSRNLSDLTRGDPKRTQRWLNRSLQIWTKCRLEREKQKNKSHRSKFSRNKFFSLSLICRQCCVPSPAWNPHTGPSRIYPEIFFGSEQWRGGGVVTYHENSLDVCWGKLTNWMEKERKGIKGIRLKKKKRKLISFFSPILCPQSGSETSAVDDRLINTR